MKIMKKQIQQQTLFSRILYWGMKRFLRNRRNPKKIQTILSNAGVQKHMKILDYGAGIGSYAFEASKLVGSSGSVIAADISQSMINEINQEISESKISNMKTVKVNTYTDIIGSDFDIIFLIDVLHMLDDQKDVIEYFLNKLNPGGKLLVKFEHMNYIEILDLLKSITCQNESMGNNDWWILEN